MWNTFLSPCFHHARFRQIAQHMAKQPAGFHSCAMDAHTARWYVYSQLCSIRPRLRRIISLQLSTSIAMPFNPYRSYRVPDHLNRSRYPVTMPQPPPNRAIPMRAASFNGWQNQSSGKAPYQPNYSIPVNLQVNFNRSQNGEGPSNMMPTPKSADLGMTYLMANQTPETQEPWDGGKDSRLNENAGD